MRRWRLILAVLAAAFAGAALGWVALLLVDGDESTADGDLIAYSCKERRNLWYAVCTMNPDGSEKRRLTAELPTTEPAWSPDSRRIAFTRNEDVGESTTFTDDDVFVMDADGSDVEQLTPERDGRARSQPAWSPDGREIAYVDGRSVASTVPSRFGALFVMSDDGRDVRRLTASRTDGEPAWSPDGREIVFVRGENLSSFEHVNIDLFVVPAQGGNPRRLTRTPNVLEEAPAWSPDGSQLAFARLTPLSQFSGGVTLWVMNRDGGGERRLLAHRFFAGSPTALSWSPDGRHIAFETSTAPDCTVVAVVDVDVDGAAPRRLTSCKPGFRIALAPAWRPASNG